MCTCRRASREKLRQILKSISIASTGPIGAWVVSHQASSQTRVCWQRRVNDRYVNRTVRYVEKLRAEGRARRRTADPVIAAAEALNADVQKCRQLEITHRRRLLGRDDRPAARARCGLVVECWVALFFDVRHVLQGGWVFSRLIGPEQATGDAVFARKMHISWVGGTDAALTILDLEAAGSEAEEVMPTPRQKDSRSESSGANSRSKRHLRTPSRTPKRIANSSAGTAVFATNSGESGQREWHWPNDVVRPAQIQHRQAASRIRNRTRQTSRRRSCRPYRRLARWNPIDDPIESSRCPTATLGQSCRAFTTDLMTQQHAVRKPAGVLLGPRI